MYRFIPTDTIRQVLPLLGLPLGAVQLGYVLYPNGDISFTVHYPPGTPIPPLANVGALNVTASGVCVKCCRHFGDPSLSRDMRCILEGVQ